MTIVVSCLPTAEGRAALTQAAAEAGLRDLPLVVVHSSRTDGGEGEEDAASAREVQEISAVLDAAGVRYEVRSPRAGREPAEDIIAVARELSAALIVIGLRRRTPVGKLILGSNAQRILLDASCPVLAVKAEPEPEPA